VNSAQGATGVLLVAGPATGGVAGHVAGLAAGLAGLGREVAVYTSPLTAARIAPAAGVEVVPAWPVGRHDLGKGLRTLRSMIRAAGVVHAHGHQAGLSAVLAAATLAHRPPVIVTWHNAVLGSGPRRQALALAELVQVRRADLLTGASSDLVARARQLGARDPELTVVSAPAAAVQVEPEGARRESGAPDPGAGPLSSAPAAPTAGELPPGEGPVVLTVSRIAPQKRLDLLVDAAALLATDRPHVRWVVAGDGDLDLLDRLETRRDRLAAPVTFLGRRTDIPALLAAADVFALSSDWEARPLAVQEAMAAGVPVAATAVGGVADLLGDSGELVPPGSASALASAVGRILADPDRAAQLSASARARAEQLPTEAEVTRRWHERYLQLSRSSG